MKNDYNIRNINMTSNIIDIYEDLFDRTDIFQVICKYVAYSKAGLLYDFGSTIIPKGTHLYRIRQYEDGKDFSNPIEWEPSPFKRQNRCNHEGETALYLGSTKEICILETYIKQNCKYVLAEYEVISDIEVGGFIYSNLENDSKWKILAGDLFNAFLIAPNRTPDNIDLFNLIDSKYNDTDFSNIRVKDINITKTLFSIPLRIAHINKLDKYYNITNQLCDIIKHKTPKGIRYSSCYIPVEITGIRCTAYNICLYESALKNIKFNRADICINDSNINARDIINTLLQNFEK